MKWIKKGLIFKANNEFGWIRTHAQIPSVLVLEDCLRVYFATRPVAGYSVMAMMDLDKNNPTKILKLYDKPVLEKGEAGAFDEHGVMPNFVFKKDNKVYMYYVGWSRREEIPYSNWMGLLESSDNGLTFKRCFKGPVFDRTRDETLSSTGVWVVEKDNEYYGFYANGTKWYEVDGNLESAYEIVACKSNDLINWERNGKSILKTVLNPEANTRPTVVKINDLWHMWFCYRGVDGYREGKNSYKIGYAYSCDLKTWIRDDKKSGIELSKDGWDSEMMPYPYVVKVDDRYLMFYNGNGFGQSGFGWAELGQ